MSRARASRAIATVMNGALAAAWLGPEVAVRAAELVGGAHYAGSFFAGTGLYACAALLLARSADSTHDAQLDARPPRGLTEIAAQADFRVAMLAALTSYAVMSFIMTATSISMHLVDLHHEVATKRVIQAHLLAMYLPSLASGWIIARIGIRPVIVAGALLMAGCVAIAAFAGHAVPHYGWALVLPGIGWNLLFIAGTTLLTRTHRPHERIQVQTLNDFLVCGAQAGASLLAGYALSAIGWERLNLAGCRCLRRCYGRSRPAAAGGRRGKSNPGTRGCGRRAARPARGTRTRRRWRAAAAAAAARPPAAGCRR